MELKRYRNSNTRAALALVLDRLAIVHLRMIHQASLSDSY
jgi:hypothetical protein